MLKKYKYLFLIALLLPISFLVNGQNEKIKGITVVAPPSPFKGNPMKDIKAVNANWIALVPYGFTPPNQAEVKFNLDWQWWGEKKVGVIECIQLAKKLGLKIMLKPQVYIPGSWVGEMDFKTEKEWIQWEKAYTEFISFWTNIAAEYEVDMLCVGTEFKIAIQKRTAYWKSTIENIRCDYDGLLTYSSNWDAYQAVPFWEDLDFIGISAYFPLSESITPNSSSLQKKWNPIKKEIEAYSNQKNKKVLFTEYGYLTVDGCAGKAWENEKKINQLDINQQAQANAYDALYVSFWEQPFWAGCFLWKWFPEGMGHEGYPEKDYTPQNKLSQKTVSFWYSKN